MASIVDLPSLVDCLGDQPRERFQRLFWVDQVMGSLRLPSGARALAEQRFGSATELERQHVIRVVNQFTFEGALYNPVRGRRPLPFGEPGSVAQDSTSPFAHPLRDTSADVFGRVRGRHCITAANLARWEGWHGVLIFDEPDPLRISAEALKDAFAVSLAWARCAHRCDPQARYFVWMWNGGLKGGASVAHAHAQMALGRTRHYARVEFLRRIACEYHARFGSNYFQDLLAAHADLGLSFQSGGVAGFVYLTPVRPKEIWLLGTALDDDLALAVHKALRNLIEHTQTQSFVAIAFLPPLFDRDTTEDWSGFPAIVRLADRGPVNMVASDIGAIDLYAHASISADPFVVRAALKGL
ncbi:MAG: hypothetical protein RMM31_00930 [Anaerolineae bacterium]|nr:hypothetical protein [Thermoflexales bacterium]MDW8394789.1 hypothetical protein [Anaerolineae bacterium]